MKHLNPEASTGSKLVTLRTRIVAEAAERRRCRRFLVEKPAPLPPMNRNP